MLTIIVLISFMIFTNRMKVEGIKILKSGKIHGIFVVMLMKIIFWLSALEMCYLIIPQYMLFALPVVFLCFLSYLFMEKNLFVKMIKNRKKEVVESL